MTARYVRSEVRTFSFPDVRSKVPVKEMLLPIYSSVISGKPAIVCEDSMPEATSQVDTVAPTGDEPVPAWGFDCEIHQSRWLEHIWPGSSDERTGWPRVT